MTGIHSDLDVTENSWKAEVAGYLLACTDSHCTVQAVGLGKEVVLTDVGLVVAAEAAVLKVVEGEHIVLELAVEQGDEHNHADLDVVHGDYQHSDQLLVENHVVLAPLTRVAAYCDVVNN